MPRLNCNEFESRLHAIVEAHEASDDGLRAHVAECDSCARHWDDHQLLAEATLAWNAATPRADSFDGIVAAWRKEFAPKSIPNRQPASAGAGRGVIAVVVAAVLLLAVTLIATRPNPEADRSLPGPSDSSVTQSKQPKPALVQPTPDGTARDVERIVAGFQSQYSGLKKDVSLLVAGVKVEWPQIETDLLGTNAPPNTKQVSPAKKPKAGIWRSGFDPIQRDVRKAFGFLQRAVPNVDDPST